MTPQRSAFHRNGLALSLSSLGEGKPFLFQHGLCGAASQPQEVFPAGKGWRCLTLECRGHGASPVGEEGGLSIAAFADDLAAFIDESGLGPLPIGGISMGAAIALRLAVQRPDLVSGLVLARPAWIDAPAPPNLAPNALAGQLLAAHPASEALARFDTSPLALALSEEAPDNLASIRSFFAREPKDVTAALLCRISADGPGVSKAEIAALRVPVLVIGHGMDHTHPLAMALELAGLIKQSRFADITPKSVDLAQYRADFSAALARFLIDLEIRSNDRLD
jgi:pimeloyl-ACP methyl ester carboxylesterase